MSEELLKACEFIKTHTRKNKTRYKLEYHFTPNVGWMNDPNGFIFYKGEYHLFYQYYPYDIKWGPMHWGHTKSKDLIHWENLKVALAPDQDYDRELGCFSGSAIEKDGKLYVMYTGATKNRQTQNIAIMNDLGEFEKYEHNPVIDEKILPDEYEIKNFRDPKIVEHKGKYYAFIGVKKKKEGTSILLYKSSDLLHWEYVNDIYSINLERNGMIECPDYLHLKGYDILMFSPQFISSSEKHRHQNVHSVVYVVGHLDFNKGTFEKITEPIELDNGFDFYATQTTKGPLNQTIMVAWEQMWDRNFPTSEEGWVGSMILPRVLTLKNLNIIQTPISLNSEVTSTHKLKKAMLKDMCLKEYIDGEQFIVSLLIDTKKVQDKVGLKLRVCNGEYTDIYFEKSTNMVVFDRTNSGVEIKNLNGSASNIRYALRKSTLQFMKLKVIVDNTAVEIYVDDCDICLSGNIYSKFAGSKKDYLIDNDNSIVELEIKNLKGGNIDD